MRCFRDDFPRASNPGKAEESVKDPRIIRHCHENDLVLITTDKNLCYTHIETVKKTDIVIIATQSNNEPIAVWIEALIKGKAKIERLIKHTAKKASGHAARKSVRPEPLVLTKTIGHVPQQESDRVKGKNEKD